MPYADASTVLVRKFATYQPDLPRSGASDVIPGWLPSATRRSPRRVEVGGRLTLTPEVLWFRALPVTLVRADFGLPVEEIVRLEDVSHGLRKRVRVRLRSGIEPTFLLWGVPRFIEAVERARSAL
ncbi:hypothetical protein [Curtobacterium luteum]|uniref:hypothetical protein n=1 Tax=Curtobacterium luteum TaxID=33881 RepID=UPI0037FF97A2